MTDKSDTGSKYHLMETTTEGMLAQVQAGQISLWSDDKKREFVDTFHARTQAARYILEQTARKVAEKALEKQYMSARHCDKLALEPFHVVLVRLGDVVPAKESYYGQRVIPITVGGRELAVLDEIACERADQVLAELPPLRAAMLVLDPEVAKQMDDIEKLTRDGQKLHQDLLAVTEPIVLSELDQSMTLGAFHVLVEDRDEQRHQLIRKLSKLATRGNEMEAAVAKKLYAGLPGLTDAVMQVIREHIERSKALDEMGRRVDEQVRYGDSEAALELLRHFEVDELAVSSTLKQQFRDAMTKLRESVKTAKPVKPAAASKVASSKVKPTKPNKWGA